MKRIKAFSLAELLIVCVIIGVLALMLVRNLGTGEIDDKAQLARVFQAINAVQQASVEIMGQKANCPAEKFITKILGTYEYAIVNSSGTAATTTDVADMYGDHIGEEVINFCDYTSYCSVNTIKGFEINRDLVIGLQVSSATGNIEDCPNEYYMPKETIETASDGVTKLYSEKITKTAGSMGKCWGKLYINVNPKGEGTLGKDIFIYGMGEQGVVY